MKESGFSCFLVGGAIRNILMKQKAKDYDLATNALPEEVMGIFRRTIPTGIKHGTVTVLFKNSQLEVTTFRIDGKYSDSRRPEEVHFSDSLLEDLKRRDFTINAIAFDLINKKLVDPHQGQKDLKKKIIRAIGNPVERFNEDGLRLMRACRFAAQLGFRIEEKTFRAMKTCAANIEAVSWERIRDELCKILGSDDPVQGLELLTETDLNNYVLPELLSCRGVNQRSRHYFDVYYHLLYSCEAAPRDNLILKAAALFHDIAKPLCLKKNETGENTFHGHENASAQLTETILKRLKFSNNEIRDICHLIKHHMFDYSETWSDSALRRFVSRVGLSCINDLVQLRMADRAGQQRKKKDPGLLLQMLKRIEDLKNRDHAFGIKDLDISGKDIMKGLKIDSGPVIGSILDFLLEAVLDDPELNQKNQLMLLAKNFHESRIKIIEQENKNNQ